MTDCYDRQGNPMTHDEWVQQFGAGDEKLVALSQVGDAIVSTVWIGLNHQWGDGPPLIFETMIFEEGDGDWRPQQWRWSTEDEALAGHCMVVDELAGETGHGVSELAAWPSEQ